MKKPLSERQTRIVDEALKILVTEGPRRFTTQRLADRVGVTTGAIFRHFATMEAIVDAVVDRVDEVLRADFPPPLQDPIERLATFFRSRTRTIAQNPEISRLLLSDPLSHVAEGTYARRLDALKRASRGVVIDCLREADERQLLAPTVTKEAGAVIVLGAVLALVHAGAGVSNRKSIEALSDDVWSTIEGMLRGANIPAPNARRPTRSN